MIKFRGIPVFHRAILPNTRFVVGFIRDYRSGELGSHSEEIEFPIPPIATTSDEETAAAIADRLLDRSPIGALTLELLHKAVDSISENTEHGPTYLVMSPDVRRAYESLIASDQRY